MKASLYHFFIISLLLFGIFSCVQNQSNSSVFPLFSEGDISEENAIKASNVIKNYIPIEDDRDLQYIYVVNSGCSFCITKAIDCYNSFKKSLVPASFCFLLKTDYPDLFMFYLNRDTDGQASVYDGSESIDLEDGLFTIKHGEVVAFYPWKQ